jgi:shikimate kinase
MSRILLIGPPGAGKSTVGAALAKELGVQFVDTDQLIEKKTGKSITDIFVVDGEPHFRALEVEVLKTVLTLETGVVSLGGGAPISEEAQRSVSYTHLTLPTT